MERPVPAQPEPSIVERMLADTLAQTRAIDNVLRGKDGQNGLVSKVNTLWAERDAAAQERRLKIMPKSESGSALMDPKVWAIWGGVLAGFLSLAADLFRYFTGG